MGVSNLPDPANCTMILIDHQPLQFAGVQNIDGTLLVNNVVGLAKTAKVFWRTDDLDDSAGRARRTPYQRGSGCLPGAEDNKPNHSQHLGR
jgi:hypothetical protein